MQWAKVTANPTTSTVTVLVDGSTTAVTLRRLTTPAWTPGINSRVLVVEVLPGDRVVVGQL